MTERESWVPPTCGRCGIFYGMALKEDESDMMAKEKSLVGFCEWREGVVGDGKRRFQTVDVLMSLL